MSSPHSPTSFASKRVRRTARSCHKSKPGTPSGETRGRASRFRLWLPDGPLVRLVIRCRDTDYCPDGPDCEAVCASMNRNGDLEIRCPYLPLEV